MAYQKETCAYKNRSPDRLPVRGAACRESWFAVAFVLFFRFFMSDGAFP